MHKTDIRKRIRNYFDQESIPLSIPAFTLKSYTALSREIGTSNERVNRYFELQKSIGTQTTLSDLPKIILQQKYFKNFQSCQILIHKKGGQSVRSLHYHQKKLSTSPLPVAVFNKIALTIKKSKHKRFDQSQLDLSGIETLGPFLAHFLDDDKYNVIVVISHNGFLPPSQIEEEDFYHFLYKISPYLFSLIHSSEISEKNEISQMIIEQIPFAFKVFNKKELKLSHKKSHGQALYYNLAYNIEYEIERLTYKNSSEHYHLERINLLGELLNTLKHELMNPLFGLNLGIQMLDAPKDDEDTQVFLSEMLLSVSRSQSIIDNFSTLYSDSQQQEEIDFGKILQEVITLTKSETKQIKKSIHIPQGLIITTNKTSLSQVLFNLIINAAQSIKQKYENESEGIIQITMTSTTNRHILEVSDNGLGVSPELQKKIFTPFFTTKEFGTGLGLTICQNLVKKLSGSLEVNNNNEGGATFKLILRDK